MANLLHLMSVHLKFKAMFVNILNVFKRLKAKKQFQLSRLNFKKKKCWKKFLNLKNLENALKSVENENVPSLRCNLDMIWLR